MCVMLRFVAYLASKLICFSRVGEEVSDYKTYNRYGPRNIIVQYEKMRSIKQGYVHKQYSPCSCTVCWYLLLKVPAHSHHK